MAERIAERTYRIRKKHARETVANNLKIYIQQATEFYEAARAAKANTAPLFFYYSFLNLAKGLCELNFPKLHERPECYRHGLSWRPNRRYLVNMQREEVSITTRGIWHLLWESVSGTSYAIPNPTKLKIRELFSYCPEISVEHERTFGGYQKFIDLEKPEILYDEKAAELWVKFSIYKATLKLQKISAPKFLSLIETSRSGYREVKPEDAQLRTFESSQPLRVGPNDVLLSVIHSDIAAFNIFAHWGNDQLEYAVPVQIQLPIRLPQLIVLYTILFWLGSLVRYDPHSVSDLMDSEYWILIDGFMNQSRVWLLELFEWAFYQVETTLRVAR